MAHRRPDRLKLLAMFMTYAKTPHACQAQSLYTTLFLNGSLPFLLTAVGVPGGVAAPLQWSRSCEVAIQGGELQVFPLTATRIRPQLDLFSSLVHVSSPA